MTLAAMAEGVGETLEATVETKRKRRKENPTYPLATEQREKNHSMTSPNISKLKSRVRKEQKILRWSSILFIAISSILIWRDFIALQDALEKITEIEREESPTSDIFRLLLLTDVSSLFAPLGILLLHIIAAGASIVATIYFFAEKKTHLLLAIADEIEERSEPVAAGQRR